MENNEKRVVDIFAEIRVDDIQKYVLGNKSDGTPRAIFDAIQELGDKKKGSKKDSNKLYEKYMNDVGKKKKNKKKKKKKKKSKIKYL